MTPVIAIALAFIAGDLAGLYAAGSIDPAIALVACVAVLVLLAKSRRQGHTLAATTSERHTSVTATRIAIIALAGCGIAAGSEAGRSATADCRARLRDGAIISGSAAIDGLLAGGGRVILDLERVKVDGRSERCRGPVRARLPGTVVVGQGTPSHVVFEGTWWPSANRSAWPVPAERTGTLSMRSVRATRDSHVHPLLALRNAALRRVRALFGNESALAEALLLARRDGLDDAVRRDFAAAGLAHLLAISGAHVGILAGIVLLLARVARLGARAASIVSASAAVLYVVFLGAPSAAARAAVQTIALSSSRMLQRPADAQSLLALAALAITAVRPFAPLDPGFQLSFAGVYGLLAFTRPVRRALPESVPRFLRVALVPTLAASAATTPIAAWHFGMVSLIGPIANLAAAPLLALAVPAMALALGVSAAAGSAGRFLAGGAGILLRLLRGTAHFAAGVPGAAVWVAADSVTALLIAAAVFALAGAHLRSVDAPGRVAATAGSEFPRRQRRRVQSVMRAAIAIAALLLVPAIRPASGRLEIHAIDVGQGDAFAIRTPRDRWILVDAGPVSPRFDAGRDRIAPYLRRHGVHRIDLVILTHPHADHIGGMDALQDAFDIGSILDPAVPTGDALYGQLIMEAARAGRYWIAGRAGRELRIDDVAIDVLAPEDSLLDDVDDPNDLSIVFRLTYGAFAALFTGDAPRQVENRLVARHGTALASRVLKVGHHGSRTSTGDSLVEAVRPEIAIVPVGRRNRYGHPNAGVLQRLVAHGARIVRMDEDGSIVIRVGAGGAYELLRAR